jgi:hypothetical protein
MAEQQNLIYDRIIVSIHEYNTVRSIAHDAGEFIKKKQDLLRLCKKPGLNHAILHGTCRFSKSGGTDA